MKTTNIIVIGSLLFFESGLFYHNHQSFHEHIHNEIHFDTFTNNYANSISGDSTNSISSIIIEENNELD